MRRRPAQCANWSRQATFTNGYWLAGPILRCIALALRSRCGDVAVGATGFELVSTRPFPPILDSLCCHFARVGPTHRSIEHAIGRVGRSDRSAQCQLETSVEPLLLRPRRDEPGDPVLLGCLARAGYPLVYSEGLPDHRAARAVVLPRPPDDVEAESVAGLVIPLAHRDKRLADSLEQDARLPVGRPPLVSGWVVQVALGGFRRLGPPQHGPQGRLEQRLAQRSLGPEGGHDLGRVVFLAP
jgi:hypothetical protein